jgi:predicted secreted hydrolase
MRSDLALALAVGIAASAARPAPPPPAPARAWAPADPAHRWSFPRDHHLHPELRNEWWYFTGLLAAEGEPGRRLGYQLTFFRVGLVPDPPALDSAWATGSAVMVHAAVTDLASGAHVFSEVLWRATPLLGGFGPEGDPLLAWARAPPGTDGRWTLRLLPGGAFALAMRDTGKGLALDLTVRPERPPVLQGPNGYSRKAAQEGFASLYYSFPRLATEGTVSTNGRSHAVRGTSWMDRELGSSQLAPAQVGWDWWGLRLADGRDLMLYALRGADGAAGWRSGTLVERDGEVRLLGPSDWTVEVRGRWTSPATGVAYPSGWRVAVPGAGIDLAVEPAARAAEDVSRLVPGLAYWEGPVRARGADGAEAGEGYVELTGYGRGGRLPL